MKIQKNIQRNIKLPHFHIGMRIVKSATAVFLCFLFYKLFRKDGILFYSQLAALWCMQPLRENMLSKAWQRTVGTLVGAAFGLLVLLLDINFIIKLVWADYWYAFIVSLTIVLVIYMTILLRKQDASYFSCVVFLSVVVIHIGDANPYLFVLNRVLDTMIGIIIGMGVNEFRLPRRREQEILFISGMDETLLEEEQTLSAYSRVELNRMLDEGAQFTISTKRTPASLLEPLRGIHLKLPVIAMDGAVMYDINKHEYLHSYVISSETSEELVKFLDTYRVNYFLNMILDNMLIIQYKELKNEPQRDIYEKLHTSPYRNYTQFNLLGESKCIYVMLIEKKEVISSLYTKLQEASFAPNLRMVTYDSTDYPGYAYIKIYNKNATRTNMIAYLKKETGLEKTITFGSIEGQYDVIISDCDHNKVVRTLKKMYEPYIWKGKKR